MNPVQVGFSDATLEPGIRYYFKQARGGGESSIYSRLYGGNAQNSTKAKETLRSFASFGQMASVAHGDQIPADTWIDGYATTFTHVKYGKLVGIDRESIDDDQYGIVRNMGTLLGDSVRATKEIVAHTPFNQAFITNLSDGVPLVSNAHPITKAGGVGTNVLATPLDPGYSCWAALNTLLLTQKDSAGMPKMFLDAPKIWLVHPDFYDIAIQAVDSTSTSVIAGTGTTNPNSGLINPWAGKTTVVASPWLTDNDASFLIAVGRHEGYFFTNRDASPESWMEKNPEAYFTKVAMRLSAGFADWRGVVGTPGA